MACPAMNNTRHLRLADYIEKPWKNGLGSTQDILILPPEATDDSFDLRLSLTPIPARAAFSPFPGIERVITLIEGSTLELEFADHTAQLHCGDSLAFGPDQCPIGKPETPARVINVMARRAAWQIKSCTVVNHIPQQDTGDLACLVALSAPCPCRIKGQNFTLSPLETIAITGPATIEAEGHCLFVQFSKT